MDNFKTTYRSFDILFRKKIPYWSALLMGIMFVCFVFLLLLYLSLYPSNYMPGEMRVAYYIIVVPNWLKDISAYSFLGIVLLIPLYNISKSYTAGLITFQEKTILVNNLSDQQMSKESIKKIYVNDVRRWFTRPREATEVVIRQTGNRHTSFLLKHYEYTEAFIESLSMLEDVEFKFYNEFSMNTHDDD